MTYILCRHWTPRRSRGVPCFWRATRDGERLWPVICSLSHRAGTAGAAARLFRSDSGTILCCRVTAASSQVRAHTNQTSGNQFKFDVAGSSLCVFLSETEKVNGRCWHVLGVEEEEVVCGGLCWWFDQHFIENITNTVSHLQWHHQVVWTFWDHGFNRTVTHNTPPPPGWRRGLSVPQGECAETHRPCRERMWSEREMVIRGLAELLTSVEVSAGTSFCLKRFLKRLVLVWTCPDSHYTHAYTHTHTSAVFHVCWEFPPHDTHV